MNQRRSNRTRSRAEVMAEDANCVYCGNPADSQEHMPPIVMFKGRDRPGGMEFATCANCNRGTSAADSVAAFLAKISFDTNEDDWQFKENILQRAMLNEIAPGFLDELFDANRAKDVLRQTPSGVIIKQKAITADGPLTRAYVSVFATKVGMALFRELTGKALPSEGGIEAWYYLNAGLSQEAAESILSIMPGTADLSAGRKRSGKQFAYRFNTDGKSIVAGLASFHNNLHVVFLASSTPEIFKMPYRPPRSIYTRPGGLAAMMPKIERSKLIALPGLAGPPYKFRVPAKSLD